MEAAERKEVETTLVQGFSQTEQNLVFRFAKKWYGKGQASQILPPQSLHRFEGLELTINYPVLDFD